MKRVLVALAFLCVTVSTGWAVPAPEFVLKWGSTGTGDGQFDQPMGIALDANGNVYVVDSKNNRIQKFDSNGNFLLKWGSSGTGNGQFNQPAGIALDANGNVFTADTFNDRIQKFDSNGNFLLAWGTSGIGDGQLREPFDIAVDGSGDIFVADLRNRRIQKFDSIGNFLNKLLLTDPPFSVAVDALGNVYVSLFRSQIADPRIQKFDSSGIFLLEWGPNGSNDGEFKDPVAVAVNAAGNVYVADGAGNSRVQEFDSDGNFLAKWGSPCGLIGGTCALGGCLDPDGAGPLELGDGQFCEPVRIAVGLGGIYVTDRNQNRVQKFEAVSVVSTLRVWALTVLGLVLLGTSSAFLRRRNEQ